MNKNAFLGRAALFSTAIIWGTSFVILKNTLDSIGTMWILALRFTISAVIFALIGAKELRKLTREALQGGASAGLCLALAYILQTYGLYYTTPGKNAFLTATYCVLTPFAAWIFRKKRPGAHHVLAGFLCIIGIGFVSLNAGLTNMNKGDMLTLGCGIFYTMQIIVFDRYVGHTELKSLSCVEFAVAAAICWVGAALTETPPVNVPVSAWSGVIYLSIMCTAVCFFLQAWGMKYTPASTAAVIMTLESVFGTIISVIFYHEQMTARLLFGFALIFLAVLLAETGLQFRKKEHV